MKKYKPLFEYADKKHEWFEKAQEPGMCVQNCCQVLQLCYCCAQAAAAGLLKGLLKPKGKAKGKAKAKASTAPVKPKAKGKTQKKDPVDEDESLSDSA